MIGELDRVKRFFFGDLEPAQVAAGLILAAIIVVVASYLEAYIASLSSSGKSPVSVIMIAIVLGIIIKNTVGTPEKFNFGIKFCLTKLLRLGIITLGIGLTIYDVIKVGAVAVGIVAVCIVAGVWIIGLIGRVAGLDEGLGTLIGVGTSICGATAIVAMGPVIEAKREEIAYAVATITIFGIVTMFAYPYLAHFLHLTDVQSGILIGTGVHETSQVAGAGLMYNQLFNSTGALSGGNVAVITKLVRNIFLALVVPLMALSHTKRNGEAGKKISPVKLFPVFILGFIAMAIFRSFGDFLILKSSASFLSESSWQAVVAGAKDVSKILLAVAMAGIGLGTDIKELKKLGAKPFLVGLTGSLTVGAVSLGLVILLGRYLVF